MRRARLDAIERGLSKPEEEGQIDLPASEEDRHRLLLEWLVELSREAYGAEDPRADAEHLGTLTYRQVIDECIAAQKIVVKRDVANGEMDWFTALPYEERIRLCRKPKTDWDEIDRLKRAYEANRDARPPRQC